MKKLFILLFVLQLPILLLAQQPFGKNATWTVAYENEYGYRGFRQISYSHDTIINGESWQKFSESGVHELRTGPDPSDLIQGKYSGIESGILFMTRNDSVFRMDANGKVNLSFDFNAQLGDGWQMAPWDTSLLCVDTPFVKVVNMGSEIIDGKSVKYWDIVDPLDTLTVFGSTFYGCSAGSCMGGRLYEKIGALFSSLNFNIAFYNFAPIQNVCGSSLTAPSYLLRCYQDDSLDLNFSSQPCDFWNFLNVEESALNADFKIFPNPNSYGELNIESLNEFDEIQISNVSGQIVQNLSIDSSLKSTVKIDLKDGLYFLQLKNKGKLQGIQKLIIQ
jgi:hypothetical protein